MRPLSAHDEALLAAAKAAAAMSLPSAAQTTRRARVINEAIARHAARQRRAVPRLTVAGVVFAVAGAASATTAWLALQAPTVIVVAADDRPAATSSPATVHGGRAAPRAAPTVVADAASMVVSAPATPGSARETKDIGTTATAPRAPGRAAVVPTTAATPTILAGATSDGVPSGVAVLPEFHEDRPGPLTESSFVADGAARAAADGADDDARALRDRCVAGLRVRRDRAALRDCRAFGQRYPGHEAARALAFGAGGLAEELGALTEAVDAYSRAILLSPLVGATGDDALLARARVHAARGDDDEARADLRIYLRRAPQARDNVEVVRLARALGLSSR
ncbi:MAG: hypothetical protein FJ137_10070 [Deltaproteobacteria bacterium]|nr:hypothetical protein [Deltaproteobacteria bacterium]